jgi:NADH:ubiquinone oxidoreductase subunit 3 (subunit A)
LTGIWYVIGFAFAAGSFTFLTFGAAWLISHRNRGDIHKGMPYESGIDTYGDTHGRFGLSFYIYALLFVAFDIEVIFIYLWALVFPAARGAERVSRACWCSWRSCCSGSAMRGARACSAGEDPDDDRHTRIREVARRAGRHADGIRPGGQRAGGAHRPGSSA